MSSGAESGKPTPNGSGKGSNPTPSSYIEDFGAPEIFVNDLSGLAVAGSNVHMTFTTFRRNALHSAGAHVVTARLVMPLNAFTAAVASMQIAIEPQEKSNG